jgi:zinc transporter ZupT
MQRTL